MRTEDLKKILQDNGYRPRFSTRSAYDCNNDMWLGVEYANPKDGCDFSEVKKFYANTNKIIVPATIDDLEYLLGEIDKLSGGRFRFNGVIENNVEFIQGCGIGVVCSSETSELEQVTRMLKSIGIRKSALGLYAEKMKEKGKEVMEDLMKLCEQSRLLYEE